MISTSSAKPILSISSASSRTKYLQLGQVEGALFEVVHDATGRTHDDVNAAPQRGELHAVPLAAVDGQHVHALAVGAYFSKDSQTCSASSRVGARTRAWGVFCERSSCDKIGSANAAVLPVPVWAIPTTSWPSSRGGMVAA